MTPRIMQQHAANQIRRRAHRKSRKGCLECKRRHIKCDERRPTCINCNMADRECKYADLNPPPPQPPLASSSYTDTNSDYAISTSNTNNTNSPEVSTSDSLRDTYPTAASAATPPYPPILATTSSPHLLSSRARSLSEIDHRIPIPTFLSHVQDQFVSAAAAQDIFSAPGPGLIGHEQDDPPVNLYHAELLINFSLLCAVPEMVRSAPLAEAGTRIMLEKSRSAPFLLYEILAISARHLATTRPSEPHHIRHAVQLQNRAISLFNETLAFPPNRELHGDDAISAMFFSSLLGRHILADTLSIRTGGIEALLSAVVQCGALHKGLRAVASHAWPYIHGSELMPLMTWGSPPDIKNTPPQGHECEQLLHLLAASSSNMSSPASISPSSTSSSSSPPSSSSSPTLDEKAYKACCDAAKALQLGFDDLASVTDNVDRNHFATVSAWTIIVPREFYTLLGQRRGEALAVLAYYAVLLHKAQDDWNIKDAGAYMLHQICDYLGAEWALWLAWPREAVGI